MYASLLGALLTLRYFALLLFVALFFGGDMLDGS
jgi:hypothetical protein